MIFSESFQSITRRFSERYSSMHVHTLRGPGRGLQHMNAAGRFVSKASSRNARLSKRLSQAEILTRLCLILQAGHGRSKSSRSEDRRTCNFSISRQRAKVSCARPRRRPAGLFGIARLQAAFSSWAHLFAAYSALRSVCRVLVDPSKTISIARRAMCSGIPRSCHVSIRAQSIGERSRFFPRRRTNVSSISV